jgi:hypothetical protein
MLRLAATTIPSGFTSAMIGAIMGHAREAAIRRLVEIGAEGEGQVRFPH